MECNIFFFLKVYNQIRADIHQHVERTFLNLLLYIFLYLEKFESNTISDWLTHEKTIRSSVTFLNLQDLVERDEVCS